MQLQEGQILDLPLPQWCNISVSLQGYADLPTTAQNQIPKKHACKGFALELMQSKGPEVEELHARSQDH